MNTELVKRIKKIADDALLPIDRAKQLLPLALQCGKVGLLEKAKALIQEVRTMESDSWPPEDQVEVLCGIAHALLLCGEEEQATKMLNKACLVQGEEPEKPLKRSARVIVVVEAFEAFGLHERADDFLNLVIDEPYRGIMIRVLVMERVKAGKLKRAIELAFYEFGQNARQKLLAHIGVAALEPRFSDGEREMVSKALEEARP